MGILEDLKAFINMEDIYFNYNEPVNGNYICLWQYDGIHSSAGSRPQVQIKVKNSKMPVAESVINEIYAMLSPKGNYQKTIQINGKTMLVTPKQSPFYLEKDVKNRHVYIFNVDIITKRSK